MIYFIALICFLLPSYLIRFSVFGVPTTLLEILIYIAAITTLILKIKNQRPKTQIPNPDFESRILDTKHRDQLLKPCLAGRQAITNNQLLIPILLFLFAGIVSVFISPDKKEALGLFKAYIFDPILFFWVIIAEFSKENKSQIPNHKSQINSNSQNLKFENSLEIRNWKLEIIFKALIFSGLIVALHAIWQKITGQITPDGRVIGIFGFSPNYLALYLAPLAVLTFCYEIIVINDQHNFASYKKAWYYDLIFLLMIIALYFSSSRAAIGAATIGIISFLVFKYWFWIKSRKFVSLFLCFLVLLSFVVGWQVVKPNWQASRDSGRVASSNNIRWEIWKTTINDVLPNHYVWLKGVGLGNYQNYFVDLTKSRVNYPEWISPMALTPHNLFLTIWMNLGLLGLISFIWILYLFFRHNSYSNSYSLLLIAVMITILAQGLVDSPYWKNDLAVFYWLILALAFCQGAAAISKKTNE